MRQLPQAIRALIITVVIGGVAVGACLAALIPGATTLAAGHHYDSQKLDDLSELSQRSTIYDSQLNQIGVVGIENREEVKLAEVPEIIQQAVVAVEDKTFWDNNGVDLNAVFRAAIKNFTSGEIEQGGSTISQQLVKNRILTAKRDINRKIREIILAIRLNEKYSKREILEQYLNTIYFGQGSYGVKSAVERFFLVFQEGQFPRPKQLSEVSIGDAALLAGLISNPEGNNPFVYPERALARRTTALKNMVEQGYITQEQSDIASQEPLPNPLFKPTPELRPRTSWAEEVQDRLFTDPMFRVLGRTVEERKDRVLRGGLKIFATLDPKMQADAQVAIDTQLPNNGFTASLVAIDPKTGHVKAMVAGPGFESSQYNIATSYPGRQSGSTWKVITLVTGLESGFSPKDMISGASPCNFGPQWGQTRNAEGGGGVQTIRAATAGSVNCAFARMQLAAGTNKVIDYAKRMGITQDTLRPILTLTLGTIESTALEMATVAATIASSGMHHSPVFVSKIIGPDGEIVFDSADLVGERAVSEEAANCAMDMLRGVVTGGTGTAARLAGHTNWGKTGTTDNKGDANFIGATPQLAAFVWHGHPLDRRPGAGFGGGVPARIFKRFMDAALAGQPDVGLPAPGPFCARPAAFVTEAGRVASINGLLPGQQTVPTQPPGTVQVINPTTLPTILPTTTKPCVDADPVTPGCQKGDG